MSRGRARGDDRESALEELSRVTRLLTGRPLAPGTRAKFERYVDLLALWNKAQRLTGFDTPGGMVRGLFIDSLLFLPLLPPRPLRMADIGAGAGAPGLPLALVDEGIAVTLIEARQKRVSFLNVLRRELGLQATVTVAGGRAEALRDELVRDGLFDVALARAAGSIERLLPTALAYLKPGGQFIAAGPPPDAARAPAPGSGYALVVREYAELGLRRAFWVARNPGDAPGVGMASREHESRADDQRAAH